jgi:hypothetical protein
MFTELQQQKNNKLQIFKTDTIHQLEIAAETFVDYLYELHPVKGITPSRTGGIIPNKLQALYQKGSNRFCTLNHQTFYKAVHRAGQRHSNLRVCPLKVIKKSLSNLKNATLWFANREQDSNS